MNAEYINEERYLVEKCSNCDGKGYVYVHLKIGEITTTAATTSTSGYYTYESCVCNNCGGSGKFFYARVEDPRK
jgi:DnaJ-class molecular chaperone